MNGECDKSREHVHLNTGLMVQPVGANQVWDHVLVTGDTNQTCMVLCLFLTFIPNGAQASGGDILHKGQPQHNVALTCSVLKLF